MPEPDARWPRSLLVAFRFVVCFFAITTLYLAVDHLFALIPFSDPLAETIQDRGLFAAYEWATERLFGPVVYSTNAGFIAYISTALIGAGAGALIWSLVDRRRLSYRRAHQWLRVYLRYLLAAVAISYGAVKVIPVQFVPPSLVALITPLGEFTRMRLLWHFMGTSTAYIVFTGLVEVAGGLLLLWRRTTLAGAILLAAAFTNVAILNFGYEVGVQINSTIYVTMALTLLAPDARRLAAAVLNSPEASEVHARASWLRRSAKALVVVLLVAVHFRTAYVEHRDASRLPALYGIYDVREFARDGTPVPPGDPARWLRLVVAERGTAAIQWTAGGRVDQYAIAEGPANGVLTLMTKSDKPTVLTLRYTQEPDGLLQVNGRVEDHLIEARLRAMDVEQMPLRRPRR